MDIHLTNLANGDRLTFEAPMNLDIWLGDGRRVLTISVNELGEPSVQSPRQFKTQQTQTSFYAASRDS